MPLQEFVARWQGGRIGSGASVFHFTDIAGPGAAQGIANAVRAMFQTLSTAFPDDVDFNFDAEVRRLDLDGTLLGVYPVTPPAAVQGAGGGIFSNGTGLMVRHNTGLVIGGRRLLGRTFMVPILSAGFAENGDVLPATATQFTNAFQAMRVAVSSTGAEFAVWSRKNTAIAPVTGVNVPGRPSTLKTRNDRV